VDDAGGDVDGLPRDDPRDPPVDRHLELALDDVDRLGGVGVQMGRQRPADRRVVDQQAEREPGKPRRNNSGEVPARLSRLTLCWPPVSRGRVRRL
jgi:hypothetical protein